MKRFIELLHDCLILKYEGRPRYFSDIDQDLVLALESVSIQELTYYFDQLCQLDIAISKTSKKQLLFESMIIRLMNKDQINHFSVNDEKKK